MMEKQDPLCLYYKLSYDDIYETFSTLMGKHSLRCRYILTAVLFAMAVVMLVLYAHNPSHIEYSFLALINALGMFMVFGYPEIKARRNAKRVNSIRGAYELTFYPQGQIQPRGGTKLELNGDKDARAFETESLFIIRPDRLHTFTIPKRTIRPEELEMIRETLKSHMKKYYNIQ
jgi:hypothetical protein